MGFEGERPSSETTTPSRRTVVLGLAAFLATAGAGLYADRAMAAVGKGRRHQTPASEEVVPPTPEVAPGLETQIETVIATHSVIHPDFRTLSPDDAQESEVEGYGVNALYSGPLVTIPVGEENIVPVKGYALMSSLDGQNQAWHNDGTALSANLSYEDVAVDLDVIHPSGQWDHLQIPNQVSERSLNPQVNGVHVIPGGSIAVTLGASDGTHAVPEEYMRMSWGEEAGTIYVGNEHEEVWRRIQLRDPRYEDQWIGLALNGGFVALDESRWLVSGRHGLYETNDAGETWNPLDFEPHGDRTVEDIWSFYVYQEGPHIRLSVTYEDDKREEVYRYMDGQWAFEKNAPHFTESPNDGTSQNGTVDWDLTRTAVGDRFEFTTPSMLPSSEDGRRTLTGRRGHVDLSVTRAGAPEASTQIADVDIINGTNFGWPPRLRASIDGEHVAFFLTAEDFTAESRPFPGHSAFMVGRVNEAGAIETKQLATPGFYPMGVRVVGDHLVVTGQHTSMSEHDYSTTSIPLSAIWGTEFDGSEIRQMIF